MRKSSSNRLLWEQESESPPHRIAKAPVKRLMTSARPVVFGLPKPFGEKTLENIWVFPKIGVPQNGWFIMENPMKMDDLGVPLLLETPI